MARYYDFVFRDTADESVIEVRGQGNTRRTAERSARWRLRNDHKRDPKTCFVVVCAYAGDER